MCFSIPYKVLRVSKNTAHLEGDKSVKIGEDFDVKKGEYLQVTGNIAVGKLTKSEGTKIRQLIKRLNSYEQKY